MKSQADQSPNGIFLRICFYREASKICNPSMVAYMKISTYYYFFYIPDMYGYLAQGKN